jgi:hypothetical protein
MNVHIVDSEQALHSLEREWNDLSSKDATSSFFSSFDYVRIAWEHFKGKSDRLFILLLRNGDRLAGIAPFKISRSYLWGIPARTIKFIAEWEGDRPGIVVEGTEELAWNWIWLNRLPIFR